MSYIKTDTLTIKNGEINSTNYEGNTNNDIFFNSSIIISFSNSGIILGGGGSSGNPGKNGLNNTGTILTIKNTGSFLGGGGGGGNSGGNGGPGGGGGSGSFPGEIGGSLLNNPGKGAGGGPSQNGGNFDQYTGGIGGGSSGGNGVRNGNGGNSESGIFNFGGGGGAFDDTFTSGYGSGGGGYGGGNAASANNGGGGGGGGGGAGGIAQVNYGGNGGYGIYNSGTITKLINSQGGINNIYGPLFYAGVAPANYNILINSTTQYGQLWCTGVTNTTGSITFGFNSASVLSSGTYSSVLKFNSDSTVILNNKSGSYNNYNWKLVSNGLYYDLILVSQPACFKIGSKILTDKGYIAIEYLRNGDLVKTLKNGYLPIIMIGKSEIYNSGNEDRIKDRLYTLSYKNYSDINEDLVLTGCHSILVDFLTEYQIIEMGGPEKRLYMTDDKLRLFTYLDTNAIPYEKEGTYTIYHISLENENYYGNYGIYANGLLIESCSIRYLKELSNIILI